MIVAGLIEDLIVGYLSVHLVRLVLRCNLPGTRCSKYSCGILLGMYNRSLA
jgi:hypothetical protein